MAASPSIRTDGRSLFEVAVRNLSQRPDPLYRGLIRPREGPSDLPLDFPELLLQPERSLRDYRSQTLNPTDPLFSELNRLIALLEDGDEVKTAYLSYIESVCRAEGKSRWKLLKGEVRLVAQLPSEAVCLLIPRKVGKEIVATSSIGELPLFARSAEEPNIVIQLENLSLDRTPLFFGIAATLSEKERAEDESDTEPISIDKERSSIIEASNAHLEGKNYRLASLTLINASLQIEEQFDRIESSFLRDTFGIETLTPSTSLHRELFNNVRSNALKAMDSGRPIDEVQRVLGRGYKRLLSTLFDECLKLVGAPPSRYALIALDGLSREELFPFSEMRFALLVERADCVDRFRSIADLLELRIIRLRGFLKPHQSNRSAVVGTPQEVATLLSTSLHNSLLLGDRGLLTAHRESTARLIRGKEGAFWGLGGVRVYETQALSTLRIYLEQWEEILSRAGFNGEELDLEKELYRPFENGLRPLLLYFGKGHYTTRQGITQLLLTTESKRALLQAFDRASSLIVRNQLTQWQRDEPVVSHADQAAIYGLLSHFYQTLSDFVDNPRSPQLHSLRLHFSYQLHGPEVEAYQSFVKAIERKDLRMQISCLERLAVFCRQRRDYWRAALTLNSASVVAQSSSISLQCRQKLIYQLASIERLFIRNEMRGKPKFRRPISLYRNQIAQIRSKIASSLQRPIDQVLKELTNDYKGVLCQILNESIRIMGRKPPTRFAMVGLGSMSRDEMCPYSDVEFFFLIEEDNAKNRSYFRSISQFMSLKITNFGETEFKLIQSRDGDQSLTPSGFSMDIGGLSPLGKKGLYELIGSPKALAQFSSESWLRENESEIILVNALRTVCHIAGDKSLVAAYEEEVEELLNRRVGSSSVQSVERTLRQARALELMQGAVDEFQPRLNQDKIDLRAFDVKKELYRLPQTVISALALYYEIKSSSTFQQIDELQARRIISKAGAIQFKKILLLIFYLRIGTHLFYRTEKEILYLPQETRDKSSGSLFVITPESRQVLVEIYRTLVPLYQETKAFINGDQQAFSRSLLYTDSIGSYEDSLRTSLQYNVALTTAEVAVALNPNSFSQHSLGLVHLDMGHAKQALQSLEESYLLLKKEHGDQPHPSIAVILSNLGYAYNNLGDYRRAIDYHEQSLAMSKQVYEDQLHPGIAVSLGNLGIAYAAIGDYQKAIEHCEKSMAINKQIHGDQHHPNIAVNLENLGVAYSKLGDYRRAIEYYEQALAMNKLIYDNQPHPVVATNLSNLGMAHDSLGDYRRAIEYYEQSLTMKKLIHSDRPHPGVATSLNNLGHAYSSLSDYRQAIEYYEQALAMNKLIYDDCPHPDVAANLNNLSSTYQALGDYRRVIECQGQSLAMRKQIYGDQPHPDVASSLNNLGMAHDSLGDYRRAIEYYEQALAMNKLIYDDRPHPDVAASLNNLSSTYQALGDYRHAIEYQGRSLAMRKQIYGDQPHPDVASSLNNLGIAYDSLDDYRRAIEYYEQSLAMNKQIYDEQPHPCVAKNLSNLGTAYNSLGDYRDAIKYHEQSLAMKKQIYGDQPHPDVTSSLNNLGTAYGRLGDYQRAIEYHEQALAINKQIYGDQPHPDVANSLNNLGVAYGNLSDYQRAIEYHEQALAMNKQLYSDRLHPRVAKNLNNLGTAYNNLGDYRRAIEYYEQSLAVTKQIYDDQSHPDVAVSLNNLGSAYASLGEYRSAVEYHEKALAIKKLIYGDHPHSDVAISLNNLGSAYASLSEYRCAIEYFEQSLAMKKLIHTDCPHSDVAISLSNLASVYTSLGEYRRAIEYHEQALAINKLIYGDHPHSDIAISLNNLGEAYNGLGDYRHAIEYYKKSLSMKRLIHGDQPHPDVAISLNSLGKTYDSLGEYQTAIEHLEQSLIMNKQIYGNHPHLAVGANLNNLGKAYDSLGNYRRAIDCYEQALAMNKQSYGDQLHPVASIILNNIGKAYDGLGDYRQAIKYHQQSLAMSKKIYGAQPCPAIAMSLNNLGGAFNGLGKAYKAVEYCSLSLAMYNKIYPEQSHPILAGNLRNLGDAYRNLRTWDKAIEYCRQSLEMFKKIYNDKPHLGTAESLYALGSAYHSSGNLSKAIEYLQESYEMFTKAAGIDHPKAKKAKESLETTLKMIEAPKAASSSPST